MGSANPAPVKVTLRLTIGDSPNLPSVPTNWVDQYLPGQTITWNSDYDNDGMADYLEYYAGTNPSDGASGLKVVGLGMSDGLVELFWTSSSSELPERRRYKVFSADADALSVLTNPNYRLQDYEELADNPGSSGIFYVGEQSADSNGTTTSILDDGLEVGVARFYRVFLSYPVPE